MFGTVIVDIPIVYHKERRNAMNPVTLVNQLCTPVLLQPDKKLPAWLGTLVEKERMEQYVPERVGEAELLAYLITGTPEGRFQRVCSRMVADLAPVDGELRIAPKLDVDDVRAREWLRKHLTEIRKESAKQGQKLFSADVQTDSPSAVV